MHHRTVTPPERASTTPRWAKRAARLALLVLSLLAPASRAWAASGSEDEEYSKLEQYTLERELNQLTEVGVRPAVDEAPEGKTIESIEVVVLDVFDEQDPVPLFVNQLHVRTRERVIRRELLLQPGGKFRGDLARESERNLRAASQLSLVLLVPLVGSSPDKVRLLVIARDVWSLRLNWDARFQAGKLERLLIQPSEQNLFGTHLTLSGLFALQLDRYVAGAAYINPRVVGTGLRSSAYANLIFNRDTGRTEGSYGGLSFGQPLYSSQDEWSYGVTLAWRSEVVRRYVGGVLATYPTSVGRIPYQYHAERIAGDYRLRRSFGRLNKLDLSIGAEATRRVFAVRGAAPAAAEEFMARAVPRGDTRASPFVQLEAYSTRYHRSLEIETLGLQEDLRLGHQVALKLYPAAEAVGSSRDLLGSFAALGYSLPLGDGLIRLLGSSLTELAGERSEAEVTAQLRVVSPRFGAGRLHYDALVGNRYRNYLNDRYGLGGETRPRGYPSFAFIGKDRVASSVEYRSTAVRLWGAELGAVAFYDAASAFNGYQRFALNHSVGAGVRGLLPMFDRAVFRVDWGFPIANRQYRTLPGNFVFTFAQAFDLPQLTTPDVSTGFSLLEP